MLLHVQCYRCDTEQLNGCRQHLGDVYGVILDLVVISAEALICTSHRSALSFFLPIPMIWLCCHYPSSNNL